MDRLMGSDSDPESDYHSVVDSSFAESAGSVQMECTSPEPVQRHLRKRKMQGGRAGTQFMQCCVAMRDVPVHVAWSHFRDNSCMANQIPGILGGFAYLEGDGEAGSVYVASYTPQYTKPGEERYVVNKVEVRDEMSHLHAVSCVGGKYRQRYNIYLSFLQVLPDEVFGDSSCLVIWRLEYQLRDLNSTAPKDSMSAYKLSMELFKDMYSISSQVERPILDHVESDSDLSGVLTPWRLRGTRGSVAHAKLGEGVSVQLRRKKPRVQSLITDDEAMDGESDNKRWTGRKRSNSRQRAGVGAIGNSQSYGSYY